MFLIRESDFEPATGDQRQYDDGHEQKGIFEKQPAAHDRGAHRRTGFAGTARVGTQPTASLVNVGFHSIVLAFPAAPLHSITSSARAITVGGISRPIAFAVFKLITNSNVTGCAIRRSSGLVPRKILSV